MHPYLMDNEYMEIPLQKKTWWWKKTPKLETTIP